MAKSPTKHLYDVAQLQQGFFTTKQAKAAGFDEKNHPYYVQHGHWVREQRGIYRLAQYPRPERPDLLLWSLWSRNRQEVPEGSYSHQTALSLHELSDVMPAKLHMSVPRRFRRMGPIPKILILHKTDLPKSEIEIIQGIQVTKPLRTIADLLGEASLSEDVIRQALREALARGLITRGDVKKNPHLAPSTRERIEKMISEAGQ